jgi:hypothetical protein
VHRLGERHRDFTQLAITGEKRCILVEVRVFYALDIGAVGVTAKKLVPTWVAWWTFGGVDLGNDFYQLIPAQPPQTLAGKAGFLVEADGMNRYPAKTNQL